MPRAQQSTGTGGHERRGIMRSRCGRLNEAWYAAARRDEVPAKKPLSVIVLGERIVLWRDTQGMAHAHLDRCLHRNSLLSEGIIVDGGLACPYHGWTYDGSGTCTHIPSMGPGSAAPAGLALETFHLVERHGLVWLWMGYAAPCGEPFPMPHWDEEGWVSYYMKTRFQNEVTHLVENFMDVPHTVFVHAGWFRDPARRRVECRLERSSEHVCVTYLAPDDSIGDSRGITGRLLNPRGLPLTHTDQFFLPNTTRVDYIWGEQERAFVITSTCSPLTETDTWVYTLISHKLSTGRLIDPVAWLMRAILPWYTRRVIEQDVEIMRVQREALDQHGEERFHESEADRPHKHIEALREWAGGEGDEPPPGPLSERIVMWI